PFRIELQADHLGSGREQAGGEDSSSRADLKDPSARRPQELDQRPAEGAVHQVMLAKAFLQPGVSHGKRRYRKMPIWPSLAGPKRRLPPERARILMAFDLQFRAPDRGSLWEWTSEPHLHRSIQRSTVKRSS